MQRVSCSPRSLTKLHCAVITFATPPAPYLGVPPPLHPGLRTGGTWLASSFWPLCGTRHAIAIAIAIATSSYRYGQRHCHFLEPSCVCVCGGVRMGAYVFLWPKPPLPTRDTNVKRLLSAACRRGIQADRESWRRHVLGIILTCPAPAYFIYTSSLRCRQKCWVVVVDVEQFKRLAGAIYRCIRVQALQPPRESQMSTIYSAYGKL